MQGTALSHGLGSASQSQGLRTRVPLGQLGLLPTMRPASLAACGLRLSASVGGLGTVVQRSFQGWDLGQFGGTCKFSRRDISLVLLTVESL